MYKLLEVTKDNKPNLEGNTEESFRNYRWNKWWKPRQVYPDVDLLDREISMKYEEGTLFFQSDDFSFSVTEE